MTADFSRLHPVWPLGTTINMWFPTWVDSMSSEAALRDHNPASTVISTPRTQLINSTTARLRQTVCGVSEVFRFLLCCWEDLRPSCVSAEEKHWDVIVFMIRQLNVSANVTVLWGRFELYLVLLFSSLFQTCILTTISQWMSSVDVQVRTIYREFLRFGRRASTTYIYWWHSFVSVCWDVYAYLQGSVIIIHETWLKS